MIDLRSDTVTLPTPEMREAMSQAFVGDDVFGDDPTITILKSVLQKFLAKKPQFTCLPGP